MYHQQKQLWYLSEDIFYLAVISDFYVALKCVLQIWPNYHTRYYVKDPLQDAFLA